MLAPYAASLARWMGAQGRARLSRANNGPGRRQGEQLRESAGGGCFGGQGRSDETGPGRSQHITAPHVPQGKADGQIKAINSEA